MLRQVTRLPAKEQAWRFAESPVSKDVRDFARSGMEYAECVVNGRDGKPRKGSSVAISARAYIERAGIEGVTARSINGTCYLIREVG